MNTTPSIALPFLNTYPILLQDQVRQLMHQNQLSKWLLHKYPKGHSVQSNKALFEYAQSLKNEYMRQAPPLAKVNYDNQLHIIQHALGTHSTISRVQGQQLKSKREIKIASLFKNTPPEFLKMIVVHELAHIKVKEHDKSFYQLCTYMEPQYHQFEFDLRVYLCYQESVASADKYLW